MKNNHQIPTILILFGATGDLMGRKIVPALFNLYRKSKFPKPIYIIGFGRRNLTNDQYRQRLVSLIPHGQADEIRAFVNHFYYQLGDFNDKAAYHSLSDTIHAISSHAKICAHKLFYLAVPPQYYSNIFTNLHISGSLIKCADGQGWTRVIVEKPFGKDSETAQKLDNQLSQLFEEDQIYRIDHYLAKEMLQNILSFRFANNILEDSWNSKMVEKIEIKLWETLGVEDRIQFYDGVGALRDVGQNHLMQMLSLITMENPNKFEAAQIRQKRANLLALVKTPDLKDIKSDSFRAQYQGYQEIDQVVPHSKTETFFKIKFHLTSPRWKEVPIFIESGKKMKNARKEIIVTFKHPNPCFCPKGLQHYQNKVVFQLEPKEKIIIQLLAKKPSFNYEIEPRQMQFSLHRKHYQNQYAGEYEKLLSDAIMGDQTLFVSSSEIKEMWRIIDPIEKAWDQNVIPLKYYKPNSNQASKMAELSI